MAAPLTPQEYLFQLELHGIKLGLDNIAQLLAKAGAPHQRYPTVHVAGTNGKGSVVAMLDAILMAAGYKTGRFTSPHLCDVRERFLLSGRLVESEALDELIEYFRGFADEMQSPPTFFEVNTAIAFEHFARRRVDIALIEVGMGGRFDSTNVISPLATAVTNIALEHTQYLGETLAEIAFEKGGIIKNETPLVLGEEAPEPLEVLLKRANECSCPIALVHRDFDYSISGGAFTPRFSYEDSGLKLDAVPLRLCGAYQGKNAAVAVRLARSLGPAFPRVDAQAIRQGLMAAVWPCRLDKVLNDPPVIIDVAHNAAGARELATALEGPCVIILAVSSDKNAAAILDILGPVADTLILTQFAGSRALPVESLSAAAGPCPHKQAGTLHEAIALGMGLASEHRPLVITGSLYTAGEARAILTSEYGAPPLRFVADPQE